METTQDIRTTDDIKLLVDSFYKKVLEDDTINFIFTDIAKVNWEAHLPKMYAFWEFLLLDGDSYRGNPMHVHRELNEAIPLTRQHFDQWIDLFTQTVDTLFAGDKAEEAKSRARLIALTWVNKFEMERR